MGQFDVYEFLKKNKDRWYSTDELREVFKLRNISENCRKVSKMNNIQRDTSEKPYRYRYLGVGTQ